jgi:hypothetical protein
MTWLTKAVFEPPTGANNSGTDLNGAKASSKKMKIIHIKVKSLFADTLLILFTLNISISSELFSIIEDNLP